MNPSLSDREFEALDLISSGLTYKEAAKRMMITVRMVNFHLAHARQKLGAANNAQAVKNYWVNQARNDGRSGAPAKHS